MSEIKVDKLSPQSGTELTLGDASDDFLLPNNAELIAQSGSTITIASGATLANAGTATGFGGSAILQRKFYHFSDGATMTTAGAWTDVIHPLGDGTISITPTATSNILELNFRFFIGHLSTWRAATLRILYSHDGGSGWNDHNGLGNDGGYGGQIDYGTANKVGAVHSGKVWVPAANTNAHTFKWQYYTTTTEGANAWHLNHLESNHAGGTAYSSVIVTEWDATDSSITSGAL